MFKRYSIALAMVAGSFAAGFAFAEKSAIEFGAGVNYFDFEDDGLEDDFGARGLVGYHFNEKLGLELVVDSLATNVMPDTGTDVDALQYYVQGLYHFYPESILQPYIAAGWGQLQMDMGMDDDDETTISTVGAGLKWVLTDHLALRGSVNHFFNTESTEDHTVAGLTLSYLWGLQRDPKPAKPKPVTRSAPSDADGDGVVDAVDRCAATPSGVSVDARGCPLDTDADGVADYQDACPDTAARLKVDGKGCPITLTENVAIELKVNFDSNSDVVKPEYFTEIRKVADFMAQYDGTKVEIQGHTDTSGSASYNKDLSQRRASAVAQVLINEFSIDAARVTAVGYGEEQPIADESTREGRLANRRVVAEVSAEVTSKQVR